MPLKLKGTFDKGDVAALNKWADYMETQLHTGQSNVSAAANTANTAAAAAAVVSGPQPANTVFAGPPSGAAANPNFRKLIGADLPFPTATTIGGVESFALVTHQFLTSVSLAGVFAAAQPAFSDLTGSATLSQETAAGSAGDVQFSNGTTFAADANLFWDSTNHRLAIGGGTPASPLRVVGLQVFASNAAAITGGLSAGDFYRTGADPDLVAVVH